ncbi:MAG TPA: hypothetical protein VGM19_13990 [Armatimonadota bacterium]|jgi:hypothetical protein
MNVVCRRRPGVASTRLLIALAAIVVVGLGVSTYWFLLKPGPEQTVSKFFKAQSLGDYRTLKQLIPSQLAAQLPADDKLPKPAPDAKLPNMEIGKAQLQGDRAIVPVTTKSELPAGTAYGPQTETTRVVVIKEDGRWKVDPMATYAESLSGAQPGAGGPLPGEAPLPGAGGGLDAAPAGPGSLETAPPPAPPTAGRTPR